MFIRSLTRKDKKAGNTYTEYRLVESLRTSDGKVQQKLLLNLGNNFSIPKNKWKLLLSIVKDDIAGQSTIFKQNHILKLEAKRIVTLLRNKNSISYDQLPNSKLKQTFETVDLNNIEHSDVKTVGAEHVVLEAIKSLGLSKKLTELGFNGPQSQAAIGQIVARAINPSSELSTRTWLQQQSGLDELLECTFHSLSTDRLYRVSDQLLKHKDEVEKFLYQKEKNIFSLKNTITLYDLTNTYIEGSGKYNAKAAFGRSKEKRSDCRLVTLGLMLDGDGFPIRSKIFPGNIGEVTTLKHILKTLETNNEEDKPLIIFDAGIVSKENLQYCKDSGYDYIVVSRQKATGFPEGNVVTVKEKGDDVVKVVKVEKDNEIILYCLSHKKKLKEQAMEDKSKERLVNVLKKLSSGLTKKGCMKDYDKILEKIGAIKTKYKASKNYTITITKGSKTNNAIGIEWVVKENNTKNGMYCIRSSSNKFSELALWNTYIMLTDIEAAFRAMKSELGMRPIYHQKTDRVDGHIFISLLAYHVIHFIRYKLKQHNIHSSWKTIREQLSTQVRLTTIFQKEDASVIHIRKSAAPNIQQQEIYNALSIPYYPGKVLKTCF